MLFSGPSPPALPTSFDICSGVGALALASMHLYRPFLFSETDEFCRQVLVARIRDHKLPSDAFVVGDMRDLNAQCRASPALTSFCDVLSAGFPCQDISSMNMHHCLGTQGSRSSLIFEIAKLAMTCTPAYVVLENVQNLLHCNQGQDLRRIFATFCKAGYDGRWVCTRSSDFGGSHGRPRIFIMLRLRDDERNRQWVRTKGHRLSLRQTRVTKLDAAWTLGKTQGWAESPIFCPADGPTRVTIRNKKRKLNVAQASLSRCGSFVGAVDPTQEGQMAPIYSLKSQGPDYDTITPLCRVFEPVYRSALDLTRTPHSATMQYLKEQSDPHFCRYQGRIGRSPLLPEGSKTLQGDALFPTPRTNCPVPSAVVSRRTSGDLPTVVAFAADTELGHFNTRGTVTPPSARRPLRLSPWFAECLMHLPIGWTDWTGSDDPKDMISGVPSCEVMYQGIPYTCRRIAQDAGRRLLSKYDDQQRKYSDQRSRAVGNSVDAMQATLSISYLWTSHFDANVA